MFQLAWDGGRSESGYDDKEKKQQQQQGRQCHGFI